MHHMATFFSSKLQMIWPHSGYHGCLKVKDMFFFPFFSHGAGGAEEDCQYSLFVVCGEILKTAENWAILCICFDKMYPKNMHQHHILFKVQHLFFKFVFTENKSKVCTTLSQKMCRWFLRFWDLFSIKLISNLVEKGTWERCIIFVTISTSEFRHALFSLVMFDILSC